MLGRSILQGPMAKSASYDLTISMDLQTETFS